MTLTLEPATPRVDGGRASVSSPQRPPRGSRTWRLARWLGAHAEQILLFTIFAAGYVAIAAILLYRYGSIAPDGASRVDNASNVVFSNDPHLAAIGFVWNPLPSLTEIPLILLKHYWPVLLARGFAANIVTSLFMAGAVVNIRGIVADRSGGIVARLALPMAFGCMPFVAEYGANGMSEAFFVFFMTWTVRALSRYVVGRQVGDLVSAGVALGLAYLSRYEASVAALGAAAVVGLTAWSITQDRGRRGRLRKVATDLTLFLMPFGVAFAGWATVSAIIVGHPFEQFSSQYGNSAFISQDRGGIAAATGQGTSRALPYAVHQMVALEPLTAVLVALAVLVAIVLSTWRPIVPVAIFGPVIAFALVAFLSGTTYGWLRFYIMEIPLAFCVVAALVPGKGDARSVGLSRRAAGAAGRGVVLLIGLALLAPAYYSQVRVYANPLLAREEYGQVYEPIQLHSTKLIVQRQHDEQVIAFINGLHAARGQILTEARDSVTIRPGVHRQNAFTETTDIHFKRDLDDPVRFGIRYILVAEPSEYFDALSQAYPSLWADGAGFGSKIADFPNSTEHFRIYRVTATTSPLSAD